MVSLNALWQRQIILSGDVLRLRFKCKSFFTTVGDLGVLCGVRHDDNVLSTVVYTTLLDWVTTCIGEFSEYTPQRISPFKRVYHLRSGSTMSTLRQIADLFSPNVVPPSTLYAMLHRSCSYIKYLENELQKHKVQFARDSVCVEILNCHDTFLQSKAIVESKLCGQLLA